MKKKIYFILLIIVGCYYKIIVSHYLSSYVKRNNITGQDKLFIMDEKYEYRNYPMVSYKLKDENPNLYEYIVEKYKPLFT